MKDQGVDIIIVLSHCGLDVDYQIARETASLIDVIVGGHTHTFMYTVKNGETPPGPDKVQDEYPAVVESSSGHKVLIVQASAFMKYVGDLIVYFDQNGHVVTWEGNPIYLDTNIKQGNVFSIMNFTAIKIAADSFLISIRSAYISRVCAMEKNYRCKG